jgi:anhydro-N-acetylmuramic acid kinase
MELIASQTGAKLVIPEPEVINYKEALIFALLGVLKAQNDINVLASVTGASRDHSAGQIFLP